MLLVRCVSRVMQLVGGATLCVCSYCGQSAHRLLRRKLQLLRRHEQMKRDLEEQAKQLEAKRQQFEEDSRRIEEAAEAARQQVPP